MLCGGERLGIIAIIFMEFIHVHSVDASSGTIGKSLKLHFDKLFSIKYEVL